MEIINIARQNIDSRGLQSYFINNIPNPCGREVDKLADIFRDTVHDRHLRRNSFHFF